MSTADHKAFLATLAHERKAELTALADMPGVARLALHIGMIGLGAAWIALRLPLWWVAVPVLGVLTAFLFTLQHECTHQTPFRTRWLNEAGGHGCALMLVQPFLWFRYFHLAHHRHTNDPARDPELCGEAKPQTWRAWLLHLSCVLYWRDKVRLLWRNGFGDAAAPYMPQRALPRIRFEARVLTGCYACIACALAAWPGAFWLWPGPLLFGFPVLRLYLLAEHGRCPLVADMFDNTRTTFTNRLVRLIAWNMPYHTEHHVFPQVPFHRLPALHADMRGHLRQTARGYSRFTLSYLRGLDS